VLEVEGPPTGTCPACISPPRSLLNGVSLRLCIESGCEIEVQISCMMYGLSLCGWCGGTLHAVLRTVSMSCLCLGVRRCGRLGVRPGRDIS
jgi:hypothetical protein